jgi:hypothetical protein
MRSLLNNVQCRIDKSFTTSMLPTSPTSNGKNLRGSVAGSKIADRGINLLNAELNPICHLLVLLGDLTFMGPCIVSIFQYTCISNQLEPV